MGRIRIFIILSFIAVPCAYGKDYYVDIDGSDQTGDGSQKRPWRTISFAVDHLPHSEEHTIKISAGTFVESSSIQLPTKINLQGTGKDLTIIKAAKTFFYHPDDPGFKPDRFLIQLSSDKRESGNQKISHLTVDGSSKRLHGGIYVHGRDNIVIEDVKVQYTNFCGIWILKTENSIVRQVTLVDCAWGNADWCSGALQFAYVDNVDFSELTINEGKGYGIKTVGHDKLHALKNFKLHDSKISVHPEGLWQNGKAPNISVEISANTFDDSEIYNCEVDNHISIVNCDHTLPPSGKKFRIHHNLIDLTTRAAGKGYGLELTIHDAEVDHNIFKGGMWGISNWAQPKENWSIHHNVFFGLENVNPGAIINAYNGNLKNVSIYNNTVELGGTSTVNFLECNNGGVSENVRVENNLIINTNKTYNHYPNRFINLEKGAVIKNLTVRNNLLYNLPLGKPEGLCKNNIFKDPKIRRTGHRPFPFYTPLPDSPLIGGGCEVNPQHAENAPDIGAYEGDNEF